MSIRDRARRAVLALGFEEGVGTRAFDSSPKANNGIITGATWVPGKAGFGRALSFNGVNNKVVVADALNLRFGTGDFAVGIWFNKDTWTGTFEALVAKGRVEATEWILYYVGEEAIRFYADSGSIIADYTLGDVTGEDHHVMFVREGDNGYLYLDGYIVKSITGIDNVNLSTVKDLSIGAAQQGTQRWFHGILDDVLLLPYAPTPIEVRMIVASRSLFTATPNLKRGLVLDLDLQEGAGMTAFDKSWYKNNGALGAGAAAPTWVPGGGLDYDGGDWLNCGNDPSLDFLGDFTFSIWYEPHALGTYIIYGRSAVNVDGIYWIYYADGSLQIKTNQTPTQQVSGAPAGTMVLDVLGHYVATRAGTVGRVYKNGIDVTTVFGTHLDPDPAARDTFVGSLNAASYRTRGIVRKFQAFNRCFSPLDVRALHAEGI